MPVYMLINNDGDTWEYLIEKYLLHIRLLKFISCIFFSESGHRLDSGSPFWRIQLDQDLLDTISAIYPEWFKVSLFASSPEALSESTAGISRLSSDVLVERMRDNQIHVSCRITLTVEQRRHPPPRLRAFPVCNPATRAPPWSSSAQNAVASTRSPKATPNRSLRRKKRTATRIRIAIGRTLGATPRTKGEI